MMDHMQRPTSPDVRTSAAAACTPVLATAAADLSSRGAT